MPVHIFVVEMTYLLMLNVLAAVYVTDDALRDALPSLGPLPVQVAWFGAVGAVLAGIGGIYFHNADWDRSYDYWHYSRPLVGAIVGAVGSLLFYVSIKLGSTKPIVPNPATFAVVAFILGFADDTFRSLIVKLTQLLLAPGAKPPPGPGQPPPA
jgi:hypothetical protein